MMPQTPNQEEINTYLTSSDEAEQALGMAWQALAEKDAWRSHHWATEGKPDGGVSYGIGFTIAWQRGSIQENGRNGAFLTEVLEACLDELEHKDRFFPCEENTEAIDLLECCLNSLKARIKRREQAGTYGTHQPD